MNMNYTVLFWAPMSGKNRWLVADGLVEFEKWSVEVQDFKKFTDHFRGIYRICLKWIKQNHKMSTCNQLDLESLGSWPTMPKNFLGIGGHFPLHTKSQPLI